MKLVVLKASGSHDHHQGTGLSAAIYTAR